jgi:hypothetical protein
MAKTFTMGTTPETVIREAFVANGGFHWNLQGEDSRVADMASVLSMNETREDGFVAIADRLWAFANETDDGEAAEVAMSLRSGMLGCIGIEEI